MKKPTSLPAAIEPDATRRRGRPSAHETNVGTEKIVATTLVLLKKNRPAELTQNMIAAKAGIDPKLIRYYFGDLEGLLTVALERLIEGLGVVMDKASKTGDTPTARMRSRIAALTHYAVVNPNMWHMISDRVYSANSEWAKRVRADLTESAYGRLLAVVEDGRQQGEFASDFDPRLLYFALLGLSEIFVTARSILNQLTPGNNAAQEQIYVDFVVNLVMHGIGAHK